MCCIDKYKFFGFALAVLVIADLFVIFGYAPIDAEQGLVQKIFYWHVASAFVALSSFFLAAIFSALYLIKKKVNFDLWAMSLVEISFVFCSIVLTTGPIWAKPMWGVWWTWEPRLTSTLFLWLILMSYFILRGSFTDPNKKRTYCAALTIFGFLDVPIIVFAVRLWRGAHPIVLNKKSNLPPEMWFTFFFTIITVFLLATFLATTRVKLEKRIMQKKGVL